ncbi:MAG TPA: PQQ-binding-like beta-propeller repeat protein [Polyangiaceae bacterium]|nr:PQQ-binding-like beta-propeller repeat protein [Polyangiaceae bacterium]
MLPERPFEPARALLHPTWWASLAILVLNDHYLKSARLLPPALTGKLSDFAGLLMAPALVAALAGARRWRAFLGWHVAVGAVFAILKTSSTAATLVVDRAAWLGCHWRIVHDPTDLWALLAVGVSARLFGGVAARRGCAARAWRLFVERSACACGLAATMATSRVPPSTPVLAPSGVYVENHGTVRLLDRQKGRLLREVRVPVGARPVIDRDVIYTSVGPWVRADDLTTGNARWAVDPNCGEWPYIVSTSEHRLLVWGRDVVTAIDAPSGTRAWSLLHAVARPVAIGPRTFVPLSGGRLAVVNAEGTIVRQIDIEMGEHEPVTVRGDKLYVASRERIVEMTSTGDVIRQSADVGGTLSWWVIPPASSIGNGNYPLMADRNSWWKAPSIVVFGMVSFDRADLRVRWTTDRAVLAANAHFVFELDGDLVARDVLGGERRWTAAFAHETYATDDELIVSHAPDGLVVARDAATGQERWRSLR